VERVVFDPSVLVSAVISPLGNPARLWVAVRDSRLEPVVCPQLLGELAVVIARPRLRRYITLEEGEEFVREVAGAADRRADPIDPASVSRDPNDDYLIALARSSRVRAIISGDRDLTDIGDPPVPVMTPARAVATLL
jgi:putative PIN family toxin of toxin-antitoxin system